MATLVDQIRDEIQSRYVRDGSSPSRLPTERELMSGFGVSRGTVRSAIADLEGAGLLRRYPGKGTFLVRNGESELEAFAPQDIATVGLIMRSLNNRIASQALTTAMDAAWENKLHLITQVSQSDSIRELDFLEQLAQSKAKAMIVDPAVLTSNYQLSGFRKRAHAIMQKAPLITLGLSDIYENATVVWYDAKQAAQQAVEHLIEQGHKRIAFIGYKLLPASREAFEGFKAAMDSAELPVVDDLVLDTGSIPHSDATADMSRNATKILLSHSARPTAVFLYWSEFAHGIVQEAEARGLRLPDDLAIAGMGSVNDATRSLMRHSVTSVHCDTRQLFSQAVRTAQEIIQVGKVPARINLPFELRIGETTSNVVS